MNNLDKLSFSFRSKIHVILQTEATECGLACIAMLAHYHGYESDLATLRQKFPVSAKGSTLTNLLNISHQLNFVTRPLKLELEDINQLKTPCILHWDFNHFVVLESVSKNKVTLVDPAFGRRQLTFAEISPHFTGVALEAWPNLNFEEKQEKQQIKILNLLGNVKGIWKSLSQILVLALVLEIFALVSPFFMQWVIDHVIVSADRDLLTTLALGFGLLMLLQQFISLLRSWFVLFMSTHLNIQWRGNVFSHLMDVPVEYYERRSLGDIVSRFGSIDRIQQTLTTTFLEAILDGLMTVFTVILMFIYSPKLAVIALITMCLYGLIRWIWYAPLRRATEAQVVHAAKQSSHFMETIRGAKTIKLFQRQDIRRSAWLGLLVNQVNADLTTQKLGLMFRLANGVLFGAENILIVWFGASLILDGHFTVGALMAFMAYKNQFDGRIAGLIDKYIQLKMLQIDAERLADIVLTEPEKLYGETITQTDDILQPVIDVKNLTFKYSETDPLILKDISFSIPANQSVAIVGPTGCGKTTLMHLLLGVHAATSGDIDVMGKSIDKLGLNNLRDQIGTVLQDDILFAGSIAENISFFDPYPDQSWLEHCAHQAAVNEDIMKMPMGYHTLVGELGSMLSGGQKQRILLARALYKKPRILFMDEATSNLDLQKEKEVNHNIKTMNITRIFIAHRPETIATADRIIALQNGVIVHDEVLKVSK
ncbi:peptidase domain-containing ABC transporter [Acinetobacter seifertii]|uniref:Peptidase domain-containing ABC transporter n=1 Tax=Acinetobacter seifertii TaxID=1530123 RepID=A0A7H2PVI0_9GAMM|nr:peptidase domain-containing ABC transporter [Acinetobacter seifertii]PJG67528.1 ABC transporter [Acinetobacter seifertii]QNX06863.1 peptidase domain-containing ABC transporter [Acinetobacter seifertii]QNX17271.1 peptidase domain-containing ABC transporter [Acinetobacter seifertii]